MEYSTLDGKLVMPEYGRNVQRMVEYAVTIENKEERTRCVETIMKTMVNLFPYLKDEAQKHKMYDHLAIMSDFKLDIDYPYDLPDRNNLRYIPGKMDYNGNPIKMRYYGRIVELMIAEAIDEKDEERKRDLIVRTANRMKQNYLLWNKEHVEPETIVADINYLSKGQLSCDFEGFQIKHRRQLLGEISNKNNKNNRKK